MWMKDCGLHYKYISTYVDDLLIMSKDPMAIIAILEKEYGKLKGVGMLEYYLGGDIALHVMPDGRTVIATSAKTYIKQVCNKIESLMQWKLRKFGLPLEPDYHPDSDVSGLLSIDEALRYRMMHDGGKP